MTVYVCIHVYSHTHSHIYEIFQITFLLFKKIIFAYSELSCVSLFQYYIEIRNSDKLFSKLKPIQAHLNQIQFYLYFRDLILGPINKNFL
jgi:hypothetical protein